MQGGSAGGVPLTAYTIISLLENSDNTHVSEFYAHFYVYIVIVGTASLSDHQFITLYRHTIATCAVKYYSTNSVEVSSFR